MNGSGWEIDSAPEEKDGCEFLRKVRLLSACYEPGLDWGDVVARFFGECVKDFLNVNSEILQNIAEWDGGEDEDESES